MTEMRRHHERRRGEVNGRICWKSFGWCSAHLFAIAIMVVVGFWCGMHWERVKGEITLKEVPKTELRGKR